MWRYHAASILTGLFTSMLVLGFYEAGVFQSSAVYLHGLYAGIPVMCISGPPLLSYVLQYGAVIVVAFGVAGVSLDAVRTLTKCLVILAVLIVIVAATIVLAMYGVLFEPVSVCATAVVAGITGLLLSRTESGCRRRLFLQVSGQRVSKSVMVGLARNPFEVSIKGEKREVTILVLRITNCSDLLSDLRTREAIDLCNYFLGEAAEFVISRGGYLDEWGTDGLRFYFGLPMEDESHAETACRAAFDLNAHMEKTRVNCGKLWKIPVEHGISLVSGEMAVGLYASGAFARFSAIGEEVEIAQRLCELGMDYGPAVFVTGNTLRAVQETMEFRPVGLLEQAAGKRPVEAHELINVIRETDDGEVIRHDEFRSGFASFREGDFVSALEHFKKAVPSSGTDMLLEHYLSLTEEKAERGEDSVNEAPHVDLSIH